ncbi:inositol monophosphatase family protein [Candidatus Poriferisocius sp.]|uniref:inositol monophosphatase family protein n=1 Tax=Candidatus Poriferisocius sp. TaxID=3101276 RepID=UPI003B018690
MSETSKTPQPDDHELAQWLAQQAGDQLQALREEMQDSRIDYLHRELAGDQISHRYLTGALSRLRPDDMVLSEEGLDDGARLGAERVWIIDPLDGSSDFANQWSDTWAVHVGLAVNGRPAAGAVTVPAWGRTFSTVVAQEPPTGNHPGAGTSRPRGSDSVEQALPPNHPGAGTSRPRPLVVMSRSRVRWDGRRLARHLDADIYGVGSAGVKAMAVVTGEADAWVHAGGLYEWDTCAPAAVALAAGLHASHLDGSPLRYNRHDPAQWGILICRPDLAADLQAAFAA